jgi:hypothetical protein
MKTLLFIKKHFLIYNKGTVRLDGRKHEIFFEMQGHNLIIFTNTRKVSISLNTASLLDNIAYLSKRAKCFIVKSLKMSSFQSKHVVHLENKLFCPIKNL